MPNAGTLSIPPITEPMGLYWEQPDVREFTVYHRQPDVVMMSQASFNRLKNYSASDPSGVYVGKMWRRLIHPPGEEPFWALCWYDYSEKGPNYCRIRSIRIDVTAGSTVEEFPVGPNGKRGSD